MTKDSIIDEHLQKLHFDKEEKQYAAQNLLTPPLHTQLELNSIADEVSSIPHDAKIIDFGAGSGRCCLFLTQKGHTVAAVDLSEKSLQALNQNASRLGLPHIQTSTQLPLNQSAAAIVGADILHHVDIEPTFKKFHITLAPGGKIAFSEPGAGNPFWYLYLGVYRREWSVEKGILQCTPRNFTRNLRKAGFCEIQVQGFGLFPNPLFNWSPTLCRLNLTLGNLPLLRHFAYRYIITARKAAA
jgi:2-polyprenyl-3-methyl-5-hydroxy-6-metoxy-1,4-benzoquinol methylase